jgi:hypothetical protein
MIRALKDKTLSRGLTPAINAWIKEYGTLQSLEVDSRQKRIELEILLHGEPRPIHVTVDRYELVMEEDRCFILSEGIVSSREWIDALARNFLAGRRFEIPRRYAKMLKIVL